LIGKLVVAVSFPEKQISPIQSECLVTGFHNLEGMLCFVSQSLMFLWAQSYS